MVALRVVRTKSWKEALREVYADLSWANGPKSPSVPAFTDHDRTESMTVPAIPTISHLRHEVLLQLKLITGTSIGRIDHQVGALVNQICHQGH